MTESYKTEPCVHTALEVCRGWALSLMHLVPGALELYLMKYYTIGYTVDWVPINALCRVYKWHLFEWKCILLTSLALYCHEISLRTVCLLFEQIVKWSLTGLTFIFFTITCHQKTSKKQIWNKLLKCLLQKMRRRKKMPISCVSTNWFGENKRSLIRKRRYTIC